MYVEKRLLSRADNDNSKRNGDPDWPASQKIPGIKRERRTIIGRGWRFVDEKLAVKWFSWIGRVDSALNRFCLSIDNLTASNYGPWHVSMQFARFCNRSLDLWSFEWTKKDYKEVPWCFTRSMKTRLMLFVFVKLKIVDVIWSTPFVVEHFHAKSVWKAMVFDIVRWRDLNYYSLNEKYLKILLQRKLILNIDIRIII